jgi:hypothetical protein
MALLGALHAPLEGIGILGSPHGMGAMSEKTADESVEVRPAVDQGMEASLAKLPVGVRHVESYPREIVVTGR